MQATRTGHNWIIQTENNKEEIALLSFLSEHKRDHTLASTRTPEPHAEASHPRCPHFPAPGLPHDL